MITIKIYNDYCYFSGTVHPNIIDACTLTQQFWYKKKFLLKESASSKYHIDRYRNDFRYTRLIQEAEYQNKGYAIPLQTKVKYKESDNIFLVNFPETKKRIYFNIKNNSFPTGWLFSKVIKVCKELKLPYVIDDCRNKLNLKPILAELPHTLRDYQLEAYKVAVKKERGILALATGSGKSLMAAKILSYYGLNSLYIVPSLNLVYQTHKVLADIFGEESVGFIGDGEYNPKLFTVATQQTLWSRKDKQEVKDLLYSTEVLVLDEAHKVEKVKGKSNRLGNTWYEIAMQCCSARVRLALTATPGKANSYSRLLLEAVTGKIIYELGSSALIKQDYLAKPYIYIYTIPLNTKFKNWQAAYKYNIFHNDIRNNLIVEKANELASKGKRVLVVVDRIAHHGKVLMEKFGDTNIESLYGSDKSEIRLDVLDRFKKGKTLILLSTLIKEGVDLPEMDAIILANAGKGGEHGRKTIQTIGRCLRKADGKDKAIIIDFYDADGSTLERHSNERLKIYKSEPEFEIQVL